MNNEEIQKRGVVESRVKKEDEFPQDPEKRFEAIFSAIGNSEAKCLTLLCLSQSPQTGPEIHKQFLQCSNNSWKTDQNLQKAYCQRSLIPIGLVAESDILYYGSSEYVTGYRLTDAGTKFGQPIAAFLLEKSANMPYSLLQIFGQTASGSGKSRSVINRANILEVLSRETGYIKTADLAKQLGMNPSLAGQHLYHLASLNLIEYDSIDSDNKGFASYLISPEHDREKVQPISAYRVLTDQVMDILLEGKGVSNLNITERLKQQYPNWSVNNLRRTISHILSGLTRQAFCQPEKFIGRSIQSQAKITASGKEILNGLILPIREAARGEDYIPPEWRDIPWQRYAETGIDKYKQVSKAKKLSKEDWQKQIYDFISEHQGVSLKEIVKSLKHYPSPELRTLLYQGRIRKEKSGKRSKYFTLLTHLSEFCQDKIPNASSTSFSDILKSDHG